MKILVVEQESHKIDDLYKIFAHLDESISIKIITPGVSQSADWFRDISFQPDLILINPETPGISKAALPGKTPLTTTVTFTSASAEYSYRAIRPGKKNQPLAGEINVTDKLLAPVSNERNAPRQRFLVRQGQKYFPVDVTEIAYFFSYKRFIFFKTFNDQKFLVEYRMEELEEMLDKEMFFRVNRAFILSVQAIEHVQPYPRHRLKISVKPVSEKEIIVSRERTLAFKSWLGE